MSMSDAEDFWEDLLAKIECNQVIPVVGSQLLTVVEGGREALLYRVLAERLLARYDLTARGIGPGDVGALGEKDVALRPHQEINDAVCAILKQRGKRVQNLYCPIYELLKPLVDEAAEVSLQPLRNLACVTGFHLFVTTTPDDLLARAIDAERHGGVEKTEHIVFAPKLASNARKDLPEVRPSGYTAVCYLFGKVCPLPLAFAIHEEDTLEFVHDLQINAAQSMGRVLSELRTQNLLLIGCDFADWLSRFFIRLSNTQRLAENRYKREFLIEQSADSGSLTLFLERFSPDTWIFPGSAREFADELARRWREKHPSTAPSAEKPPPIPLKDAIFISYSRTDLPAARRLFAGLKEIGADAVWFDNYELAAGDNWERKIRDAIKDCYLFMPLISASTEARHEGFFREEWDVATKRVSRIMGEKFIIPVVVDKDYNGDADRFRLVPDCFREVHFGHAPEGGWSDALRREIIELVRSRRIQRIKTAS